MEVIISYTIKKNYPSLAFFMQEMRKVTNDLTVKTFWCKYTSVENNWFEEECLLILKHVL